MSAAAACDCQRRVLRELGPEDAATLRQLRVAAQSTSGHRALSQANLTGTPQRRCRRALAAIAGQLDQIATIGIVDPERLSEMAKWLRANLPADPDPQPEPATGTPGQAVLYAWLRAARDHGYTLESMAEVMDLTRERVRQLAAKTLPVDDADVPPVVGVPQQPEDLPWPTILEKKWLAWPRPTLTAAETEELVELHKLGSQLRGRVSADDPRRKASEEVARRIHALVYKHGFTHREVGDILGLSVAGIRMKLSTHGYRTTPPSQKRYQGAPPKGTQKNLPIEHGTRTGYGRCAKRPEGSCDACKQAERDYYAEYRKRKLSATEATSG